MLTNVEEGKSGVVEFWQGLESLGSDATVLEGEAREMTKFRKTFQPLITDGVVVYVEGLNVVPGVFFQGGDPFTSDLVVAEVERFGHHWAFSCEWAHIFGREFSIDWINNFLLNL